MLLRGIKDGMPIGLGYFSVSFSFGILAAANGFSVWQTVLVSMANLTSAGQFAGLTIMSFAGTYLEMAVTQFVINLRYSLMAVSLSQKVDKGFGIAKRLILGFGITDEIYAVAMGNRNELSWRYFFGLTVLPYAGWTAGTFLGAVSGSLLPEMISEAFGISLFGMFIAIVVPDMKKERNVAVVVAVSVAVSCLFYYIPAFSRISSGFAVIISAVSAAAVGAALKVMSGGREEDKVGSN